MDLRLISTYQKSMWRLQFERLLRRHVNPDQLKDPAGPNSWLYFRRNNSRKYEVYLDEDFELSDGENEWVRSLNRPEILPKAIQLQSDDLLCINLEGNWSNYVRFEEQWVEELSVDTTIWDHYLFASGGVELATD